MLYAVLCACELQRALPKELGCWCRPYGFLERFDPAFTPNASDLGGLRCVRGWQALCIGSHKGRALVIHALARHNYHEQW